MFLRRILIGTLILALYGSIPATPQGVRQPGPAAGRPARSNPARPEKGKTADPAPGQAAAGGVFDATRIGSPIRLDKDWRVGISSDPAAAGAGFDDSQWAVRQAQDSIADVAEPDDNAERSPDPDAGPDGKPRDGKPPLTVPPHAGPVRRYAWFRIHVRLAPQHGPIALLVELPVSQSNTIGLNSAGPSLDVFADGRQIQPEGPHGSAPQHYQEISRLYDLNVPAGETTLTLAVRTIYIPFGDRAYTNFFADHTLRLGNPPDLHRYLTLWSDRNLFERLPRLVYSIVLAVLALFLLALYLAQKGHNEYLWLALHEILLAPIGFIEMAGSSGTLDSLWYAALVLQLMLVSAYFFFEFIVSLLSQPRRWYTQALRYTAPVLCGVGPTLLLVGRSRGVGLALALVFLAAALWILGWLVFNFAALIAAALRRNLEAGLLLVPLVMSLIGSVLPGVGVLTSEVSGHRYRPPLTLMAGPIPLHLASMANFTGVLAIMIIIFRRFLRIQRDQQRATSELAAARSVQELLIPQEQLATPGFEVDSVYNPANEVGGDFFHVQGTAEGGLLIVIGDVAGKGLKAAMNVSMLMGALRRSTEYRPARVLESLNRVLAGTESFTTCQAAWFGANGELLVANAGHVPPYVNSQEIELPGGLPLGVLREIVYEEVKLYLHPGDRVLLLSDGVVEARRPSGELFGFDRVHNLSSQSAFYIADAARSFGQEDDITVLTVRRLPQPAPVQADALMQLHPAAAS